MLWKREFIELILHAIGCICIDYLIYCDYILSSTENGEKVCRLWFYIVTDSLEREWKHNYNMNRVFKL